ncbi:hypothetical protein [Nostoc sp.]
MLAVNARLRNFGEHIVKNLSSGCYGDSDRNTEAITLNDMCNVSRKAKD